MVNELTQEKKTLKISPFSKLKVYWNDRPENYSREAKNKIKSYFAKKYGVGRDDINVVYTPVKFNSNGEAIEIVGAGIENIMDVNYQRVLMKEVLAREGRVVDFNRIIALDEKVNAELNMDLNESQHRKWTIRWIMVDNFLCFGPENTLPFSKIKGLTVVNSVPSNQGGKTTLTIDAIKFLLHGNTTKTEKNEQIFNEFSGKDELVVRGMIDIEGDETIIERRMTRSKSKNGEWKVTNKVSYYRILPDGEEDEQNEEDAKKTTKKISETVGSEDDFEMLVLATEKNLDDLIGLTTTESGKVLTRLIGLEVVERKEAISRKMYNEFDKKKKSNQYDVITLNSDIETHNTNLVTGKELLVSLEDKLSGARKELERLSSENDRLLNSKQQVDVVITTMNPSKLNSEIEEITTKGKGLSAKIDEIAAKITEVGVINFNEDRHHQLTKQINSNNTSVVVKETEIKRLKKSIEDLIAGGICQSCNRKLDNVDNTEHIKKHEASINILQSEVAVLNKTIDQDKSELTTLNEIKKSVDDKNKLELDKDRLEVEIGSLRNQITSKKNDLKKYNLNLDAIELNKKIDADVDIVKTNIVVATKTKEDTISKIEKVKVDITTNENDITAKTKLIEAIKKEEEVDKIYKIYIDLMGKRGINKLVLRSVLPIINSELQRLLDDVCDFEVEIFMNDKNDVQFLLLKDGTSKLLKSGSGFEKTASSLALRAVLGKISTLPMPNFITFDEVLGKVAPDNIEKLRTLFDKIKTMYDIVFFITHNDMVKDWADNVITVKKDNNISTVLITK